MGPSPSPSRFSYPSVERCTKATFRKVIAESRGDRSAGQSARRQVELNRKRSDHAVDSTNLGHQRLDNALLASDAGQIAGVLIPGQRGMLASQPLAHLGPPAPEQSMKILSLLEVTFEPTRHLGHFVHTDKVTPGRTKRERNRKIGLCAGQGPAEGAGSVDSARSGRPVWWRAYAALTGAGAR